MNHRLRPSYQQWVEEEGIFERGEGGDGDGLRVRSMRATRPSLSCGMTETGCPRGTGAVERPEAYFV